MGEKPLTGKKKKAALTWLLGRVEGMLERTTGADFELTALIRRIKTGSVEWHGKLPFNPTGRPIKHRLAKA